MKLWTFQSKEVVDILNRDGVHKARLFKLFKDATSKTDAQILKDVLKVSAFEWMAQKMRDKKIPLEDGYYPIWFWKTLSPELVEYYSGQDLILLEMEVPDELVLMSSFSGFEYITQYLYLNTEEKTDFFISKCENADDNFFDNKPLKSSKLHDELVQSWDKALNVEFCKMLFDDNDTKTQAVVGCLKKEWVLSAYDLDENKEIEI